MAKQKGFNTVDEVPDVTLSDTPDVLAEHEALADILTPEEMERLVDLPLEGTVGSAESVPDRPTEVMDDLDVAGGKSFDFRIHPDTMDPQTRGVYYRLRYRAINEQVDEWYPDGQVWGEIAVGKVLGATAMKAAGLTVTPEMREPAKKSDVVAKREALAAEKAKLAADAPVVAEV